tara:strand:+ start:1190 stop:2248 length:1059 start_codon:yes stop_codon:yes gene_type:complete
MYKIHKYLLLFFILVFFSGFSQTKYSNEFLKIGAGARSLSLSKAVVCSSPNASAGYWNPSSLVDITESEIELMHASYFAGIANFDQLSYVEKVNESQAIGFMMLRFGVDDIMNTTNLIDNEGNIDYNNIELFSTADYAFLLSYAKKDVFDGFDVGGNAKIIYRKIGDFANSLGFGFDVAAQTEIGRWRFAAIVRDATTTYNTWIFNLEQFEQIYNITNNYMPENTSEITFPSVQTGVARIYRINDNFSAQSELDLELHMDGQRNSLFSNERVSVSPHFGTEIKFKNLIDFRFGIGDISTELDFNNVKYIKVQPNIGIGFHFENIRIDYALANMLELSSKKYSNLFSLRYNLQ